MPCSDFKHSLTITDNSTAAKPFKTYRSVAFLDGWCHLVSEWILDANDADEYETALAIEGRAAVWLSLSQVLGIPHDCDIYARAGIYGVRKIQFT